MLMYTDYTIVQPLKKYLAIHQNLNTVILRPSNSTTRCMCPKIIENIHVKIYTEIFIAVLFITAKEWKQL